MAFSDDGAAFGAHAVRPAGRVTALFGIRVALGALERRAELPLASVRSEHPRTLLPWRAVADVLTVAALEERHPVPHLVLLEADHGAPHAISPVVSGRALTDLRQSPREAPSPDHPHISRSTMIS